jgi:hypothetical protein
MGQAATAPYDRDARQRLADWKVHVRDDANGILIQH